MAAGQGQLSGQFAATVQQAESQARASQHLTNANVPVTVGDNSTGGASSASQTGNNAANSKAANDASTRQSSTQSQTNSGSSSCLSGCGGNGQGQVSLQAAQTA